jgi:hypothetical protein
MSDRARARPPTLFIGLWLFVIFVSVLDGYLALRYRHLLEATELNPVGRALIALNGGQVWYLLAAKFLGTVLAASFVLLIHRTHPRIGITIAIVLATLQLCLLLFLFLG